MSAYHIIGDQDTVLGYRFAGVSGEAVENAEQAKTAFENALNDSGITVLLVTEAPLLLGRCIRRMRKQA